MAFKVNIGPRDTFAWGGTAWADVKRHCDYLSLGFGDRKKRAGSTLAPPISKATQALMTEICDYLGEPQEWVFSRVIAARPYRHAAIAALDELGVSKHQIAATIRGKHVEGAYMAVKRARGDLKALAVAMEFVRARPAEQGRGE